MTEHVKRFIEWDGKIPAWGLLLLGLAAMGCGWTWVNDIERRLSKREEISSRYTVMVDNLVKDQNRLVQLEVEIRYIRMGIERLENRLPMRLPSNTDALAR